MIETKSNTKVSALMLFDQLKKERAKLIASMIILDKKDNHVYPITDAPFKIPSNWVWCYLSDISLIQEGPGIRKHQYATSGVQFLTVTNILEGSVDLEKSKKYISKEQYKNYSHFTINKGDIVTACSGGSWGKSAIYDLDDKLILNTSTIRLRFYNDLGDNYYLYYLTKTNYFKDSLSSYATGQQPNYGYSHYSKIPIPLPSLAEQKRIVATLDEVFAAIAKAKANAEQNLKNAKELFESYLQGVFENKGDGWEEKRCDEICVLQRGFDLPTHSRNEGSHPLVSSNGITDRIDLWKVKSPGVVTGRSGTIGNVHYIEEDYWPLNTALYVKEFHGNYERFIYFFLKQFDLGNYSSGAGVPTLNRNNVHSEMVWFPKSIKEQQAIVQKLDALSAETKKLEAIYNQKVTDLEELKKSILQKAFSGELKVSEPLIATD